jgi:hypothetical protein
MIRKLVVCWLIGKIMLEAWDRGVMWGRVLRNGGRVWQILSDVRGVTIVRVVTIWRTWSPANHPLSVEFNDTFINLPPLSLIMHQIILSTDTHHPISSLSIVKHICSLKAASPRVQNRPRWLFVTSDVLPILVGWTRLQNNTPYLLIKPFNQLPFLTLPPTVYM